MVNRSTNINLMTTRLTNLTDHLLKDTTENTPLLELILVLVLLVSGISLNTCFISAYWRRVVSANHFNFCMFHLSIANLLQLIFYLPYALSDVSLIPHDKNWIIESVLCTLVRGLGLFWIAAVAASWMLCYMSLIRLRLISNPLQRFNINKRRSGIMFVVIWTLAALQWSPFFFTKKLNDSKTECIRFYRCSPDLFDAHSRFIMFTGFWIPLTINLAAYTAIAVRMYRRQGDETHANSNRHRKKVITVLGILNAIFVVCWLPMLIQWALTVLNVIEGHAKQRMVYKYCSIPCLAAGTLNIICSMNSREALKRLFCCARKTNIRSSFSADSIK